MTPVVAAFGGGYIVFRPTRSAWAEYQKLAPAMQAAHSLPDRMSVLIKIVELFLDAVDLDYVRRQLTNPGGAKIVDLMAAVDKATHHLHLQLIRAGLTD